MKDVTTRSLLIPAALAAAAMAAPAAAHTEHTRLSGYEEVPALSTPGQGEFRMKIDRKAGTISYELKYDGLESNITQSHIHLGQAAANGGISVFICTNLGNGPAGTPACPAGTSGAVSGMWTAASVVGPAGQGVAPTEFDELVEAIRAGATYVNVHTVGRPAGEIRGQLDGRGR
jgi:hypothetical protein